METTTILNFHFIPGFRGDITAVINTTQTNRFLVICFLLVYLYYLLVVLLSSAGARPLFSKGILTYSAVCQGRGTKIICALTEGRTLDKRRQSNDCIRELHGRQIWRTMKPWFVSNYFSLCSDFVLVYQLLRYPQYKQMYFVCFTCLRDSCG